MGKWTQLGRGNCPRTGDEDLLVNQRRTKKKKKAAFRFCCRSRTGTVTQAGSARPPYPPAPGRRSRGLCLISPDNALLTSCPGAARPKPRPKQPALSCSAPPPPRTPPGRRGGRRRRIEQGAGRRTPTPPLAPPLSNHEHTRNKDGEEEAEGEGETHSFRQTWEGNAADLHEQFGAVRTGEGPTTSAASSTHYVARKCKSQTED